MKSLLVKFTFTHLIQRYFLPLPLLTYTALKYENGPTETKRTLNIVRIYLYQPEQLSTFSMLNTVTMPITRKRFPITDYSDVKSNYCQNC